MSRLINEALETMRKSRDRRRRQADPARLRGAVPHPKKVLTVDPAGLSDKAERVNFTLSACALRCIDTIATSPSWS